MLDYLKNRNQAVSCRTIALHCGCSINTIRKEIKFLDKDLRKDAGCSISSIKSRGYLLVVDDEAKANAYFISNGLQHNALANKDFNADQMYRSYYIIRRLLTTAHPISINRLCDELYCSRSTFLRSLKKCEAYLSLFQLTIKSIRNHGFIIHGNEYNKRICLIFQLKSFRKLDDTLKDYESHFLITFRSKDIQLYQNLRKCFIDCLTSFPNYQISFINIPKIIHYLTLCITRKQYAQDITFTKDQLNCIIQSEIYELAKTIFFRLNKQYHYNFNETECISLTPLLLSYRSVSHLNQLKQDSASQLYEEASHAAIHIHQKFQIDCMKTSNTIEKLACHLYSLNYKYMFCIAEDFENQALIEQDGSYIIDFCLALGDFLETKYKIKINKQLMVFSYYLFSTIIHSYLKNYRPLHLLLISMFGVEYADNTAKRLLKIYQQSHLITSTYIESIDVCEFSDTATIQYKNYDLLLTDIPNSQFQCDYPIIEIDMQTDLVKNIKLNQAFQRIMALQYRPYIDAHVHICNGSKKTDIFSYLGTYYQTTKNMNKDTFIDMLQQRDNFISGERKNRIVLLTSNESFQDTSYVQVFINRSPILWDDMRCQLFIYYNYGQQPINVILTLEFLLTKFKKIDWNNIEKLIENPNLDLIDFLFSF